MIKGKRNFQGHESAHQPNEQDEQTGHGFAKHDKQLAAKGSARQEHDCTRGLKERRFSSHFCAKSTQNLPLKSPLSTFHSRSLHHHESMTTILFLALFFKVSIGHIQEEQWRLTAIPRPERSIIRPVTTTETMYHPLAGRVGGFPPRPRLVAACKIFEKASFYIWSTKHILITK